MSARPLVHDRGSRCRIVAVVLGHAHRATLPTPCSSTTRHTASPCSATAPLHAWPSQARTAFLADCSTSPSSRHWPRCQASRPRLGRLRLGVASLRTVPHEPAGQHRVLASMVPRRRRPRMTQRYCSLAATPLGSGAWSYAEPPSSRRCSSGRQPMQRCCMHARMMHGAAAAVAAAPRPRRAAGQRHAGARAAAAAGAVVTARTARAAACRCRAAPRPHATGLQTPSHPSSAQRAALSLSHRLGSATAIVAALLAAPGAAACWPRRAAIASPRRRCSRPLNSAMC